MPMNTVWLKSDEAGDVPELRGVLEQFDAAGGQVLLDFSGVHRINAAAVGALEALADSGDSKAVKIVLRSVDVAVYKVLKLMRLEPRFSFQV